MRDTNVGVTQRCGGILNLKISQLNKNIFSHIGILEVPREFVRHKPT